MCAAETCSLAKLGFGLLFLKLSSLLFRRRSMLRDWLLQMDCLVLLLRQSALSIRIYESSYRPSTYLSSSLVWPTTCYPSQQTTPIELLSIQPRQPLLRKMRNLIRKGGYRTTCGILLASVLPLSGVQIDISFYLRALPPAVSCRGFSILLEESPKPNCVLCMRKFLVCTIPVSSGFFSTTVPVRTLSRLTFLLQDAQLPFLRLKANSTQASSYGSSQSSSSCPQLTFHDFLKSAALVLGYVVKRSANWGCESLRSGMSLRWKQSSLKGWLMSSRRVIRWLLTDSIRFSSYFHSADRNPMALLRTLIQGSSQSAALESSKDGNENVAKRILFRMSFPPQPVKGKRPVSSRKRRTPHAHISRSQPILFPFSSKYSQGDMYQLISLVPFPLSSQPSSPESVPYSAHLGLNWFSLPARHEFLSDRAQSAERSWEWVKSVSCKAFGRPCARRTDWRAKFPWLILAARRLYRISTNWQKISCASLQVTTLLRETTSSKAIPQTSMARQIILASSYTARRVTKLGLPDIFF